MELWNLIFLVEDKVEVLYTVKEKLEEIRAMLKQMKICSWSHDKQKIEKEKLT